MVVNTFYDLLTVMGVLAGIGALLFVMSVLDTTHDDGQTASHRGVRQRNVLDPRPSVTEPPARRA